MGSSCCVEKVSRAGPVTSPPPPPRRGVCVPPRKYCPRWKKGIEGYSRLTNQYLLLLSAKHTHTNIAPKEGKQSSSAPRARPLWRRRKAWSLRAKSALFAGCVPAVASSPLGPSILSTSRIFSGAAQSPFFYFTFFSSYHEPPGMIGNTWPLGAAGAQEIRTLKLEGKPRQQKIRKETSVPGVGLGGGGFPASSGGVRISCLLQAPGLLGPLGVH